MLIVFDLKNDPMYKEGMEYGLRLELEQRMRKAKLEAAKILYSNGISIKKLNISLKEIKKKG